MKKLLICAVCIPLSLLLVVSTPIESAQTLQEIQCGSQITSTFLSDEQIHEYRINLTRSMEIIVYAESRAGNYQDLRLGLELLAPSGTIIKHFPNAPGYAHSVEETDTLWSETLSASGTYLIRVIGYTNSGSEYSLTVNCIDPEIGVISGSDIFQNVGCGQIIENTYERWGEIHYYFIELGEGDRLRVSGTSLAENYQNLRLGIRITTPSGVEIRDFPNRPGYAHSVEETDEVITESLSETGIYDVLLIGYPNPLSIDYSVEFGCTLADGSVINPGDAPSVGMTPEPRVETSTPVFSGVGFPGLSPVDFSSITQIPLVEGVPLTGFVTPEGDELFGFTTEAEAGNTLNVSFERLSGNLNLGLVVLSPDNNVESLASLITSATFSTQVVLPTAGEYTIGVFRIDLSPPDNPEDTVFRVQMQLE